MIPTINLLGYCKQTRFTFMVSISMLYFAILLLALISPMLVVAQSTNSIPPIRPSYGLGDREFMISAYHYGLHPPGGKSIEGMWDFARAMGITIPWISVERWEELAPLADSRRRTNNQRLVLLGGAPYIPLFQAGYGRQVVFFPFDSAEIPEWRSVFTTIAPAGDTLFNRFYRDSASKAPREMVYHPSDTGVIASGIAYGLTADKIFRFDPTPGEWSPDDERTQNVDAFTAFRRDDARSNRYYIALTAHLFSTAAKSKIPRTTPLLAVELWNEIPEGTQYVDATNQTQRAQQDTALLFTTILFTKDSLLPRRGESFSRYRVVSIPVNLARSPEGIAGPLDSRNGSQRFDIRVRYLGGETVALRSVGIRDSIGELMLGERAEAHEYRRNLLQLARRILQKHPQKTGSPLRPSIIRLQTTDEPPPAEYAGAIALNRMLQRTFRQSKSLAKSRQYKLPTLTIDLQHPAFGMEGGQDEIFVETYITSPHDTSTLFNGAWRFPFTNIPKLLDVRHNLIPSIQEHNGGRFKIPELTLDQQGIKDNADITQRYYFGQYNPDKLPWLMDRGAAFNLGRGAQFSRRTGRRLIQVPSSYYSLWIRGKKVNNVMVTDTLAGHAPEPSELRALVHMGLAYGARGIVWWWVGSNPIMQSWGDDDNWIRMNDVGAVGTTTADTIQNRVDYPFREWNGTVRRVPSIYLGWRNNSRELKAIHAHLQQVTPAMMRLRWRDGYSIHHTVNWPDFDKDDFYPRPLPSTEIVTAVTAADPRTNQLDAPHETYVELGLFDPLTNPRDPWRDTNFIYVVNRRTFEAAEDEGIAPERIAAMRALTEDRIITLQLNVRPRNGNTTGRKIRIRQINPDMTPSRSGIPLPPPLDVTTEPTGTIQMQLRPGVGTLLEVTWVK